MSKLKIEKNEHSLSRSIFLAAAIIFIVWSLSQAQVVLASCLVSVFFAVLATPPVLWLERKHVPSFLAVSIVVIGMLLFLAAIGTAVGASVSRFVAAFPEYQTRIEDQMLVLNKFLASRNILLNDKILLEYLNPGMIMGMVTRLLTKLGLIFSNTILVVLTVTFILLEASSFPIKLRMILGNPHQVFPQFTRFVNDMKRYMIIKTIISFMTGVLVALLLFFLQVDFAILWGFLAFLLNYVPNIGSIIASIPAILMASIQFGIWRAIFVAIGYLLINIIFENFVETKMMGKKLGLSTLVVFVSLIFWGSFLGPIGALLCVPLTMTLKFIFERRENTKWIAVLLGPEMLVGNKTPAKKV